MASDTYIINLLGVFTTTIATSIDQKVAEVGGGGINAATALVTIRNHPDDSIDVLRRILNLTHSGAVRLINRLEADHLVERQKHSNDGRSVAIRLTAEGQKHADSILDARAQVTNSVLDILSDEQKIALIPILEIALNAMTHGEDSARRICRLCNERVCRPQGCPVEMAANQDE